MSATVASTSRAVTPILALTIWVVALMGPLSSDSVLPGLPAVAAEFGASVDQVQLAIAGALVGVALGSLLVGVISDSLGRRGLLLTGALVMALGAVLAASAQGTVVLIIGNTVLGVGSAAGFVLGRAVFADLTSGADLVRKYAVIGALNGVGPILGAVGGALVLTLFSWRAVFVIIAVLAAVSLVLLLVFVPETLPAHKRTPGALGDHLRAMRTVLASSRFLCASGVVWFGFAAVFAYIAASPFILQGMLGFTPLQYSAVMAADGLCLLGTSWIAGRLATRMSPVRLAAIGLIVLGAGAALALIAALAGAVSVFTLVPSMLLIGMSLGFVFGPVTVLALEGLDAQVGTGLAIMASVQFLFAGAVTPLVGMGGPQTALPFGIAATIASLGAALSLLWLVRLRRREV